MPRISVIIPIYEVEPYLAACLASVAAQTWRDLEVIMVDDGSPDGSAGIAARFAELDPRFRLVRQPNAGLGAARNTGVRQAAGEFLAFLDSDDLLPVHALEYLLAALLSTGSDLATGNVLRFDGRRVRPSALHRPVFARPATATHVTRRPALLRDRLVTNKLWRRSFWEANGLAFPEGVLYEDIAVALRGHCLARSVDVLPAPVYLWRERGGGKPSITQEKIRPRHLEDRFAAVRAVRAFLIEHGLRSQVSAWDRVVLESDLTNFLDVLDLADDGYRERFLDLAGGYLDDVAASVLDELPALQRVQWHLVRQRRPADLLEVLSWDRRVRPQDRLTRRPWGYHLNIPVLREREPKVPPALTRVRAELVPRHRIDAVGWQDGKLVVEGRAALDHRPPTRRVHQQVFASLVHERTGRRIRVPASVIMTERDPRRRKRRAAGRDWGGFRLVIDPAPLGRAGRLGLWHVELRVIHRGIPLPRRPLTDPRTVWAARIERRTVGRDVHVAPVPTETGALALRAEREAARVVTQHVRDGRLRLVGHVLRDLGPAPVLSVTRRPGGVPAWFPVRIDGRTFEAEVDLSAVLAPDEPPPGFPLPEVLREEVAEWRIEVRLGDGTVTPVTAADLPAARFAGAGRGSAGREIIVLPDRHGHLVIRDQPVAAFADLVEWLPGGELLIEGGTAVPYREATLVVHDRAGERFAPVEQAGRRFRVRLTPEQVAAGALPLPRGRYGLRLRVADGGRTRDLPIELDADGPLVHETARRTFELGPDSRGHAVLTVSADLAAHERGRAAQRELRTTTYPALRGKPLRSAVLFTGGRGTRFAGSLRAIYAELRRRGADLTFLGEVRDGQVILPDLVEPVRTRGREHYEALARCRYIVTDQDLPRWFERRPGQTVLQVWHGPPAALAAPGGRPARSAGQWTHVLSPGPWWTPRLRECFGFSGFTGQVLETGLPCDDLLVATQAVDEVRRRLGVPREARVVLYVPGVRGRPLDVARLGAALPDGAVLLVWRPPGAEPRAFPGAGPAQAPVADLSAHPDPYELYRAADVLVTGHSAAMCDFAATGRPMLVHVPRGRRDEQVPEEMRLEPPGPVLRTTDEVIEAIRHIDEVAEKHAGLREAFAVRYRPLADGRAAARVIDLLFRSDGQG